MPKPWMIYGANGYTGELIAREAVSRDLRPVLAGRTAKVEQLTANLGLEARVFDLGNAVATSRTVEGMGLVLNCAGPFSATAAAMMAACLAAHAHYLDITGEISVFEHARTRNAAIIGCCQAVEHYEISRYGTLREWAKEARTIRSARSAVRHSRSGEGGQLQAHSHCPVDGQQTRQVIAPCEAQRPGQHRPQHDQDHAGRREPAARRRIWHF